MNIKKYKKGDFIFQQGKYITLSFIINIYHLGTSGNEFYIVLSGELFVLMKKNHDEMTMQKIL